MYEKQMELFDEGGLKDEGGMVDEESGNEVPVGSTRKEVRDDIPAMLSEGEFVFPADVVRYIGLENLMRMRQDAKQGLKQMDAMGQMGNADEATMPDDLPFGMMDLIIIDGEEQEPEVEKKAQGGVVHMNEGGFTTNSFRVPKFDPRNQDVRQYENADGKKLNIPFFDGKPLYPIPEGYFPVGTVEKEEKDQTKEAIPTDDDDDGGTPPPPKGYDWDTDTSGADGKALQEWIDRATQASTVGNIAAGIGAAVNPIFGAMIALANKQQKKKIAEMLDEKIAQAKKTPVEGQVAALEKIKERLTTDEGKSILAKVIDEITGTVTNALGLSKAEKATAKVGAGLGATQDPNESDKKTTDTQQKVLNELAAKGYKLGSPDDAVPKGAFSFGNLEPKSNEEILEAVKAIPEVRDPEEDIDLFPSTPFEDQAPISAPKTPPSPTEIRDIAERGARIRETTGTALETNAMSDVSPAVVQDQGEAIRNAILEPLFDDASTQTLSVPEDQTTAAFGPVETYTPEISTTSTVKQELQDYVGNLRSPVSITGRSVYEKLDPLTTLEELTNKVAEAVKPYETDRRPKPPTVPTEPPKRSSRDDDDDGPNLAQQMQERMKAEREEKEAAAKQEAANIRESAKAIESSGVDLGGKTAIQQVGLNRSKDDEDPDANDPRRGMMKSGGLASRKKKKK